MSQILDRLTANRLVPVLTLDEVAHAEPLAGALVEGGLPVAEVTFRTSAAAAAIEVMARDERMLVGAGTVLTPDQVDQAVDAGAQFVVSPGFSAAVVAQCAERGVLALPGTVTATEVQMALEAGLTAVKFFPAETSGGAAAIKALSGPFGDVTFVPTGGIGPDNVADYLALKPVAAVGGTWMVPREALAAGDFARIAELVRHAVSLTGR